MAAGKVSKNQRGPAPKKGPVQFSADSRLIIPCVDGAYAYVAVPGTLNRPHMATGHPGPVTDQFATAITALVDAGYAERLRKEFTEYGWTWALPLTDQAA